MSIIHLGCTGQLCNRLLAVSALVGLCLEKGVKGYFPSFGKYSGLLLNRIGYEMFSFSSPSVEYIQLIGGKIIEFASIRNLCPRNVFVDLNPGNSRLRNWESFEESATRCRTLYSGWLYRNKNLLKKHRHEILKILELKNDYIVNNRSSYFECNDGRFVVSIHARLGDYRTYRGGIYYFEKDVYERIVARVKNHFGDENVVIKVFSNEFIGDWDCVKKRSVLYDESDPVTDLKRMADSDLIIGPPSTFSMWASYMNNAKLIQLVNREEFDITKGKTHIEYLDS